jgi:hypothetical protein
MRSAVRQIAAVEDYVGRGLPEIRQDRLKRGAVAVDVGYDSDAHRHQHTWFAKKMARWFDAMHHRAFLREEKPRIL